MRAAVVLLLLGVLGACMAPSLVAARRPLPDGDLLRGVGLRAHQLTSKAMLTFSGYSTSEHSPRLAQSQDDDACCDCVSSVGHHVLHESIEAVKAACANVTCPFIKQRCEWADQHPGEIAGYLAVRVRPFSSAYYYCMGNASCEHPSAFKATKTMSSALLSSAVSSQVGVWESQLAAAAQYVDKLADGAKEWAQSQLDERVPSARTVATMSRSLRAEEHDDTPSNNGTDAGCHKCLRKGVKWVLKKAVKDLKEACKKTECPAFQKFCAWAKEHKDVVRGMLYAKFTPYRYAIGWCYGKGSCSKGEGEHAETAYNAPFTMGEHAFEPIIGGGDHDYQPHTNDAAIGADGHDQQPHRSHPNGVRAAYLAQRAAQAAAAAARVAQDKGQALGRILSGRKH